jgi:hypothetical protein
MDTTRERCTILVMEARNYGRDEEAELILALVEERDGLQAKIEERIAFDWTIDLIALAQSLERALATVTAELEAARKAEVKFSELKSHADAMHREIYALLCADTYSEPASEYELWKEKHNERHTKI